MISTRPHVYAWRRRTVDPPLASYVRCITRGFRQARLWGDPSHAAPVTMPISKRHRLGVACRRRAVEAGGTSTGVSVRICNSRDRVVDGLALASTVPFPRVGWNRVIATCRHRRAGSPIAPVGGRWQLIVAKAPSSPTAGGTAGRWRPRNAPPWRCRLVASCTSMPAPLQTRRHPRRCLPRRILPPRWLSSNAIGCMETGPYPHRPGLRS